MIRLDRFTRLTPQHEQMESTLAKRRWSRASSDAAPNVAWQQVIAPIATACVYYIAAVIGSALAFPAAPVSALWAPNALLMAVLLLVPTRRWWIYLLAVAPFHVLAQVSTTAPIQILLQYVFNCAEAVIGAAALVRFEGQPVRLGSLRAMANLILIGGIASPLLTSLSMAGAFSLLGLTNDVWLTVIARTITNTFATIILVPLVLRAADVLRARAWRRSTRDIVEATIVAIALIAVSWYVFVSPNAHPSSGSALLYAPLPLLILATVRFGLTGVCGTVLLVGSVATWGVLHGSGPFVSHAPVQNALATVAFLNVTCVPLLLLAAVLAERKRSAAALERSQRLHRSVMASLRDGIAVLDSRGIILEANESWLGAPEHGPGSGAQVGDDYFSAVTLAGHQGNPAAALLAETLKCVLEGTDTQRELELSVAASDEVRWYEVSVEALLHPERGAVITVNDVTARKRAEIEVQEQHHQLAHLARAAILGEFSGAIAHEIRQPLTSMLANAETAASLMSTESVDRESVQEALGDIIADNLRAAQVIQRVQSMLRKTEHSRTKLQLGDLVRDSLVLTRGDLMRHHVSVRLTLDEQLPLVIADRVQIQQVLLNLFANACDSMACVPEHERVLTIVTRPHPPTHIEVAVSDSGTGIEREQLEHIFDPFVTSKKHGLGLGLSICRTIVAEHGGRLWAENLERGAAFHLTLPHSVEGEPTNVSAGSAPECAGV
jgi:signal transduction histidine kinase